MTTMIDRLLRRSHLFDDPSAYEAGVLDAIEALERAGDTTARAALGREPVSRTA
jgi:hypothetical protein